MYIQNTHERRGPGAYIAPGVAQHKVVAAVLDEGLGDGVLGHAPRDLLHARLHDFGLHLFVEGLGVWFRDGAGGRTGPYTQT